MDTIAKRLRYARKEKVLTQVKLADLAGIEQSDLSKAENGKILKPSFLLAVSRATGCDPFWLETGHGEPFGNSKQATAITGRVPLLSSVQAGDFKSYTDNFLPYISEEGKEMIPTTAPVRAHTFALKVAGDSMSPRFPDGTILIVEPEPDPQPGNFVIARIGEETTFKQLVKDSGEWLLKPLNPQYPIRALGDAQIIGVVRSVEIRLV